MMYVCHTTKCLFVLFGASTNNSMFVCKHMNVCICAFSLDYNVPICAFWCLYKYLMFACKHHECLHVCIFVRLQSAYLYVIVPLQVKHVCMQTSYMFACVHFR